MRAAAILGLGCSPKNLKPFQAEPTLQWQLGVPAPADADAILLFGGDGTIHRHLAQLVKLALPVLIVPAGSGNDFARALGIKRVRDSLAAWQKFIAGTNNVRQIDLGLITPFADETTQYSVPGTRYFACVAGIGLDAEVARKANALPRWLRGHGGYALTLAPMIFHFAPFPMHIQVPDANKANAWTSRTDQPTTLAAFANTPVYGGGMKIAPKAKMDDGLLDICVVAGVNPLKLFSLFPTVYSGNHLSIREVDYFTAQRAQIRTEQPLDLYADGEYVCHTPVEIAIQPAALNVITP